MLWLRFVLVLPGATLAFVALAAPLPDDYLKISPTELKAIWADLGSKDKAKADEAQKKLLMVPKAAIGLVAENVSPATKFDADRVEALIKDLGQKKPNMWQPARDELVKNIDAAEPVLRTALEGKLKKDSKKRIEEILESVPTPNQLQAVRAVEVLEKIGTPEARVVLDKLSKGAPDARLTRAVLAALGRMDKKKT